MSANKRFLQVLQDEKRGTNRERDGEREVRENFQKQIKTYIFQVNEVTEYK